jgi:hypothetical protein
VHAFFLLFMPTPLPSVHDSASWGSEIATYWFGDLSL